MKEDNDERYYSGTIKDSDGYQISIDVVVYPDKKLYVLARDVGGNRMPNPFTDQDIFDSIRDGELIETD